MPPSLRRGDILHPELSYKIMGVMFGVHVSLGTGLQEKYYQRAIAAVLRDRGILFEQQVPVPLQIVGQPIGRYFVDFVIDNKIIVEIKALPRFTMNDFKQVDGYLAALSKDLGILVNFHTRELTYKRIVNATLLKQKSASIREDSK